MAFGRSGDLRGAEFVRADLRGARFRASDLSGVVMRGVDVAGADVDAPWLSDGPGLLVNGVDVAAYVDGELDRRFPGRAERRAGDPDGLRAAWAALERAAAMPAGTVEVSVAGEWSFAQTLRHLIMATDTWLGQAILRVEQPYHPLGAGRCQSRGGWPGPVAVRDGYPPYAEVLEARAGRVTMVRDFLAAVSPDQLAAARTNPWAPEYPETALSCT